MRISDWSSDVCSSDLALPEILVSAAIMSRSRLRPGSWTTADFMGAVQTWIGPRQARAVRGGFRYVLSADRTYPVGCRGCGRSEERRVGTECVVRVDLGGRRCITKKKNKTNTHI